MLKKNEKKTGFYPQEKKPKKKTEIFRFFPFLSEILKHLSLLSCKIQSGNLIASIRL